MVELRLVPKREPDAVEKIRLRMRAHPKPDGMLSCPRCGGRAAARIETGIIIKNGKRGFYPVNADTSEKADTGRVFFGSCEFWRSRSTRIVIVDCRLTLLVRGTSTA